MYKVKLERNGARWLLLLLALGAALVAPMAAGAAPVTVVQEPFSAQVTICNGDTVDLSGTIVWVFNANSLTNGRTQDVVGVDEQTGTVYRGKQSYFDIVPPDSSGGVVETFSVTTVLAAADGQTFRDIGLFHVTVRPDGTLAVIRGSDSTNCS